MKDFIIKGKTIERELKVLLGCAVFACLLNVYAIIKHGTSWAELITTLHYVALLALAVYVLLWLPRLLVKLIRLLFSRRRSAESN